MFKFAFFVSSRTLTPENYQKEFMGEDFYGVVCGVNSLELACETAKKLVEEGFNEIDLCGDFDQAKAQKVKEFAGEGINVFYENYTEEEMEKFNNLDITNPWGVILQVGANWENDKYAVVNSEECDTHVACIHGLEDAILAAKHMVQQGVRFIELCSYFDEKMCNQIAAAIQGAVPMGYAVQV